MTVPIATPSRSAISRYFRSSNSLSTSTSRSRGGNPSIAVATRRRRSSRSTSSAGWPAWASSVTTSQSGAPSSSRRVRVLRSRRKVEAEPPQNLVQPGVEGPFGIERMPGAEGARERLLRQIARISTRADDTERVHVRAPHEAFDEDAEALWVPRAHPPQQPFLRQLGHPFVCALLTTTRG